MITWHGWLGEDFAVLDLEDDDELYDEDEWDNDDDSTPDLAEWEPACVNGDGCPNEIRCRYCMP